MLFRRADALPLLAEKRAAAEQAETAFLRLLDERLPPTARLTRSASSSEANDAWAKAKREPGLDADPRYEAVGSSSRRAELFAKWARGEPRVQTQAQQEKDAGNGPRDKPRDAEQAMREREMAVRRQKDKVEGENRRALGAATHEER